jgi:hypothetical protein
MAMVVLPVAGPPNRWQTPGSSHPSNKFSKITVF